MYPVTSTARRVVYVKELAPEGQPGDTVTLAHGFGYPPSVILFQEIDNGWVDGMGTADIHHNWDFTETTVTNVTESDIIYLIRLL
jgi:hypothetical protein